MEKKLKIKALLFDLDDTLLIEQNSAKLAFLSTCTLVKKKYNVSVDVFYDVIRSESRKIWYKSPARSYCVKIGISSWEGLWGSFKSVKEEAKVLSQWIDDYRMHSWNQSLIEVGIENPQFAGELSQHFQKERRKLHTVYPDVISNLELFRKSFNLGLITNGAPGVQNEKLDKSNLRSFFDVIVISGELMTKKPESIIFKEALKRLGTKPSEVLMIGNSLNSDIQGGNIARITTVWLNRDKKKNETDIIPDFEISSLYEIKDILELI